MGSFDGIAHWARDKTAFCQRIRMQHSILKLVIKTKDETDMLRKWLRHHLPIVGAKNVIVFDNMSTLAETDAIYREFAQQIEICRFASYQDDIHYPAMFPELYGALRESCGHYAILDTDEMLLWFDSPELYLSDHRILDRLAEQPAGQVLPGTWLASLPYYDNRVYWSDAWETVDASWVWGLKWGKPVISSALDIVGVCRHNTELDATLRSTAACTRVFIAHLKALSPAQRVAVNLRKLRAMQIIGADAGASSVLAIDVSQITNPLVAEYCREVTELTQREESLGNPAADLQPAAIRLNDDGTIGFFEPNQRTLLADYLGEPGRFVSLLKQAAA